MSTDHRPEKGVRRFRRNDASRYLKETWGLDFATRTLAKFACLGGGPVMEYSGRIPLYSEQALDAFARSKIKPPVKSTSERQLQTAAYQNRRPEGPAAAWNKTDRRLASRYIRYFPGIC
jgi:hypothetical protein